MKSLFVALGTACLCVTGLVRPVSAGQYSELVVLGASLLDDGDQSDALKADRLVNLPINLSVPYIPPTYPQVDAAQRRYSNGPVISEYIIPLLGLTKAQTFNYANGGATTSSLPFIGLTNYPYPNQRNLLDGQVPMLLSNSGGTLDSDALFFISTGPNDFNPTIGGQSDSAPTLSLTNIRSTLDTLYAAGARHFLFVTYDPSSALNTLPNFSTQLNQLLADFRTTTGAEVIPADLLAVWDYIVANPETFGMDPVNVLTPCLSQLSPAIYVNTCSTSQENERLRWDDLHPTTHTAEITAQYFASLVDTPQSAMPVYSINVAGADAVHSQVRARLASLHDDEAQGDRVEVASLSDYFHIPTGDLQRWHVFAIGEYTRAMRKSTAAEPGYGSNIYTLSVGADYAFDPDLTLGLAASYGNSEAGLSGGSSADAQAYMLTSYASWTPGDFYFNLTGTGGVLEVSLDRQTGFAGLVAHGTPSGSQWGGSVEAGYDFDMAGFVFTPYAGVKALRTRIESYTERGAALLNFHVEEQAQTSLTSQFGVDLRRVIEQDGGGYLTPRLGLAWEHEYKNDARDVRVALVSQPGLPFSSVGDEPDRNYARLSAGVEERFASGLSLDLGYSTIIGHSYRSEHRFRAELRMPF